MAQENLMGITESLFGVRPSPRQDLAEGLALAGKNLSGGQIGGALGFAGARQLGRGLMTATGMEDPEMASANRAKQFAVELQQQGVSMQSSQGMKMLAQKLSEAGDFKAAQAAAAIAANFEQNEANIGLTQARTELAYKKAGDDSLSPAQKAIDTKFGKDYAEYFAGGGVANLQKNIAELDRAISLIEDSPEEAVSGKLVGLSSDAGTLKYTHPIAADIKDIVGSVSQSNLRQILGGQFAQKEGEQLMARQYDPAQSRDKNLERLRALRTQAVGSLESKQAAAQYYEQKGTLKGFEATNVLQPKAPQEGTGTGAPKQTIRLKSGVVVTVEQ